MGNYPLEDDPYRIVEQFAGAGGWSEALRLLGLDNHVGIEWDAHAVATARAAGHARIEADIAAVDPHDFEGAWGFIGSPPCQAYSTAGSRRGLDDRKWVEAACDELAEGRDPRQTLGHLCGDPRSLLTVEPLHWVLALWPRWVALEQVPAVLPLFELMAEILRGRGYHTWTGLLTAEQYGVPQTRKRAFLIASLDHEVREPPPTHTRYRKGGPRQEGDLLPWVSMAEALGWAGTLRSNNSVAGVGRAERETDDPSFAVTSRTDLWRLRSNYLDGDTGDRTYREQGEPAPTITGKAGRMKLEVRTSFGEPKRGRENGSPRPEFDPTEQPSRAVTTKVGDWKLIQSGLSNATERDESEPAFTITAGHDAGERRWVQSRPATTLSCDPRVSAPGRHDPNESGSQQKDAVRITVEQATALMGFRSDYPWQGPKTTQFRQVGNAVCPPVARAVLRMAIWGPKGD